MREQDSEAHALLVRVGLEGEVPKQRIEQINPNQEERRAHEIKAVIFELDALVQKGSATPLPGVRERLAALRAQWIPFAIATSQTKLIGGIAEQEEQAPDSVTATARIAANIKEIIQGLELQHVPWFVSLGDPDTREIMSSVRYQSMIEKIRQELRTLFPHGELFVSRVVGPAPAMLLAIADNLQVEPANCLYVGDKERDRQAAESAGMLFEMGP
jgi:beta-phosphoglucomutase-like phosphatase (HAD superfamily)